MQQTLESKISSIRQKFIGVLHERQREFQILRDKIQTGREATEALKELQFSSHKIRGVAATLGFARLGNLAEISEQDVNSVLASPDLNEGTRRILTSLGNMIAEIATILEGQQSTPC
jgi:HPt (histidine-containing phosphotransfer) domain-containing protein